MKIANSLNIGVGRYGQAELIPRMAGAGYDGLDFNYYDVHGTPEWTDPASAEREAETIASAASEAGLDWVQAHGPFVVGPGDLSRDESLIGGCLRAVRACGTLGVPWLVLHPFWFDGAWDLAHHRDVVGANVKLFRALLPEFEAAGVGLALENVFDERCPRTRVFGSVPEDICELVDALDDSHGLVGVCWDTGHAHIVGLEQRGAIASLGRRLKALHAHDNDGRDDFHVLPFTTAHMGVDWDAVTSGIAEAGYQGAFTLEVAASFLGMPDGLFDEALALSASIARHLAERVSART